MNDDNVNAPRYRKTTGFVLEDKLREAIKPGEKVLWQGAPEPRYLSGINVLMFSIAVMFSAVLFYMVPQFIEMGTDLVHEVKTSDSGVLVLIMTVLMAAFGILVMIAALFGLFIGTVLMWKIFATGVRTHKMAVYAVTDKRAIIVRRESSKSAEVNGYLPNNFKRLRVTERRNGLGDIAFRKCNGVPSVTTFHGFINIRNPRKVERILQDLASAARSEKQRRKRK